MNRFEKKYYHYAQIAIEALSPLVLASGKSGSFFDVELVRDANGLPAIPGTTLAGILRHAVIRDKDNGAKIASELFGFQSKAGGSSSSLEVSWGYVHDSKNCFHKGFYGRNEIRSDSILKKLYVKDNSDFKRDHVRISDKGVALDAGKFDRYFVPRGCRFTFELGLWSENAEDPNWDRMLGILQDPSFRIGAAGMDGYGKIKVINVRIPSKGYYDLSDETDVRMFKDASDLSDSAALNNVGEAKDAEEIRLEFSFPLGFRIGGGKQSFLASKGRTPDILPYSEKVIRWDGGQGEFETNPVAVIPGSSIKGVLRHRAAFHLARLNRRWAASHNEANAEQVDLCDDGLSELFGSAANKNSEAEGQSGKIWFSDLHLSQANSYQLSRNSIDRFTGGTLNGALFQEENLSASQHFQTCVYVSNDVDKESNQYRAFEWALDDLRNGRLAIGGGSGHGLGFNRLEG